MATELEALLEASAATRKPRDWVHWQQQDVVGLKHAALLTLGIQPQKNLMDVDSQTVVDILGGVVAKEYRRRFQILRSKYGRDPYLPQEARVGEDDPIVSLENLLSFGKAVGWDTLNELDIAVNGKPTVGHIVNTSEEKKGEGYARVRLGGLLLLIEEWAKTGRIPDSHQLLKGGTNLNFLQLSHRVEAKLLEVTKSETPETGLQATTIGREYGKAVKHLRSSQPT